jgi:uncharacterized membrane protein YkvA (DUF1232 family)
MSVLKTIGYVAVIAASAVYLINPTAGVFELVPDNIPFVGHVDEVTAMGLLLASWRGLRRLRGKGSATERPAKPG